MCSGIFFVDNIPIKEYKSLINRLNRIEGQIRGIKGMIERDAYCTDILVQSAAVSAAVNAFNKDVIVDNTAQMINISKEITEKMQGYFELMEKTIDDMQINQMQKLLENTLEQANQIVQKSEDQKGVTGEVEASFHQVNNVSGSLLAISKDA